MAGSTIAEGGTATVLSWSSDVLGTDKGPGRGFDPFIVSNSHEKHDTATRKRIRSHAKRGKSHQKPTVSRLKAGTWINGHESDADPKEIQNGGEIPFVQTQFAGSDLTVTRFAFDNMQPYMLDLIFKCTCAIPRFH